MTSKLPVVEVVETPPRRGGPIVLKRDCEATQIPSGSKVVLTAGTGVTITQSLGGQFTVTTDEGALLRIADQDADALGDRSAAAAVPAPATQGPVARQRVWVQRVTVLPPSTPLP